jgi:hypothetical protein
VYHKDQTHKNSRPSRLAVSVVQVQLGKISTQLNINFLTVNGMMKYLGAAVIFSLFALLSTLAGAQECASDSNGQCDTQENDLLAMTEEFGFRQLLVGGTPEFKEEMLEVIKKSIEYVKSEQIVALPEALRNICRNMNEQCTAWSVMGVSVYSSVLLLCFFLSNPYSSMYLPCC